MHGISHNISSPIPDPILVNEQENEASSSGEIDSAEIESAEESSSEGSVAVAADQTSGEEPKPSSVALTASLQSEVAAPVFSSLAPQLSAASPPLSIRASATPAKPLTSPALSEAGPNAATIDFVHRLFGSAPPRSSAESSVPSFRGSSISAQPLTSPVLPGTQPTAQIYGSLPFRSSGGSSFPSLQVLSMPPQRPLTSSARSVAPLLSSLPTTRVPGESHAPSLRGFSAPTQAATSPALSADEQRARWLQSFDNCERALREGTNDQKKSAREWLNRMRSSPQYQKFPEIAMERKLPEVLLHVIQNDTRLLYDNSRFLKLFEWAKQNSLAVKFELFWFKYGIHQYPQTRLMLLCDEARRGNPASVDFIKELIATGNDPWEIGAGGVTALLFAVANDWKDMIEQILCCNVPIALLSSNIATQKQLKKITQNLGYAHQLATLRKNEEACQLIAQFAEKHGLSIREICEQEVADNVLPDFIADLSETSAVRSSRGTFVSGMDRARKGDMGRMGAAAPTAIREEDSVDVSTLEYMVQNRPSLSGDFLFSFLKSAIMKDRHNVIVAFNALPTLGGMTRKAIRALQDQDGFTLLSYACAQKKKEAAELLAADYQEDLLIATDDGDTVAHFIARGNLYTVLDKLLYSLPVETCEAVIKEMVTKPNQLGQTPFHTACAYGFHLMAWNFVELGADPTQKTGFDETPLSLARRSSFQKLIDFLEFVEKLPQVPLTSLSQPSPYAEYYEKVGELAKMESVLTFKLIAQSRGETPVKEEKEQPVSEEPVQVSLDNPEEEKK